MNTQNTHNVRTNRPALEAGDATEKSTRSSWFNTKADPDRLKLRISLIQQIEENQFESDQVATFMRLHPFMLKSRQSWWKVVLNALRHLVMLNMKIKKCWAFLVRQKTEKLHNSRIMLLTWGIFAVIVGISFNCGGGAESTTRHLISRPLANNWKFRKSSRVEEPAWTPSSPL